MPLNHVEPFHFATQLLTAWKDLVQTRHLPRQSLQKVATPAGSQALRIPRYGIQKFTVKPVPGHLGISFAFGAFTVALAIRKLSAVWKVPAEMPLQIPDWVFISSGASI